MTTPKRKPDTGLIRPQRPKPHDFRQMYLILGWGGIVEHYNTNWRVVRRWIEEEGRDGLKIERDEIMARFGRATQYVLGKRMGQRRGAVQREG
jgi:hypothetical protein